MKQLFALLIFISSLGLGLWIPSYYSFRNVYADLCELVSTKIYYPKDELQRWKKFCLQRSRLYHPWSSQKDLIRDIEQVLRLLKISHLKLFLPQEVSEVWQGTVKKTGLISQFVDGDLIVQKIHPESPAERLQIKVGDVIVSQNGEHPNPVSILKSGGVLEFQNSRRILLKPEVYQQNQNPIVRRISPTWVLIEVPQFADLFYAEKNWSSIFTAVIRPEDRILIDLRGNRGGTFYAGLQFLSLFFCTSTEVGRLTTQNPQSVGLFPLTPKMSEQIFTVRNWGELILKTPSSSVCLQNKLSLLINQETASLAEMIAVILKEKKKVQVFGSTSSGQTMIGFWYPISDVYPGAQLLIPEARFVSPQELDLEGSGVRPDTELFERGEDLKKGVDSLVLQITDQN